MNFVWKIKTGSSQLSYSVMRLFFCRIWYGCYKIWLDEFCMKNKNRVKSVEVFSNAIIFFVSYDKVGIRSGQMNFVWKIKSVELFSNAIYFFVTYDEVGTRSGRMKFVWKIKTGSIQLSYSVMRLFFCRIWYGCYKIWSDEICMKNKNRVKSVGWFSNAICFFWRLVQNLIF